jgi:2-C-methyl-D-erythritol 4-phosphate cytidylyltransferase
VERIGVQVSIVEGSYDNIKITTPEDVALAERILARVTQGGAHLVF